MGIKKHGGSIEILTSSYAVRIPVCIPPSYGHLGQQIDLLRETEFDSSYHILKKSPSTKKRTHTSDLVTAF
nr:MAG TPA: hypothetical protein [Caudoviricetes sp.]